MKRSKLLAIQKPPIAIAAILLTFASCASADIVFDTPTNPGQSLNSSSHEFSPSISADGLSLYFASNRPGGSGNFDLWVATRASTADQWSVPVNLGTRVNSSGLDWFPSISADGLTLYFARGQGAGAHIWVTTRTAIGQPWSVPLDIGPTVTSPAGDAWPNISADDCTLYFGSVRSGGSGSTDIWVTTRPTEYDDWGTPVNLGPTINSSSIDSGPCISTDGRVLLFLSTRPGGYGQADLYMATRDRKDSQWSSPINLGPIVNGPTNDLLPTLSTDGRTLYFCDHPSFTPRAGSLGGADIWQVSISPIVDINADGIVDSSDMCIMVDHWGEDYPMCDIGPTPFGDGIVDVQDLVVLAEHLFEDYRLVAHWALDETEGIIAKDSTGYNDAYVIGDPFWQPAEGKKDGALQLDGIDDYVVSVPVLNPSDGPFSVFAWIKGGAPGQVIISQMDGTGSGETWLGMDAVSGCLMTGLVPPPVGRFVAQPLSSQAIVTDGLWHHVGFVWDGFYRILYVDGSEVATDAATLAPMKSSNGGLYIATSKDLGEGRFFSGMIDDVRVYNKALNAETIAALAK